MTVFLDKQTYFTEGEFFPEEKKRPYAVFFQEFAYAFAQIVPAVVAFIGRSQDSFIVIFKKAAPPGGEPPELVFNLVVFIVQAADEKTVFLEHFLDGVGFDIQMGVIEIDEKNLIVMSLQGNEDFCGIHLTPDNGFWAPSRQLARVSPLL